MHSQLHITRDVQQIALYAPWSSLTIVLTLNLISHCSINFWITWCWLIASTSFNIFYKMFIYCYWFMPVCLLVDLPHIFIRTNRKCTVIWYGIYLYYYLIIFTTIVNWNIIYIHFSIVVKMNFNDNGWTICTSGRSTRIIAIIITVTRIHFRYS